MLRSIALASLVLASLVLAALTTTAQAQSWFTKDACTVTDPAIDAAALDEQGLADLRAEAAKMENPRGRFWKITAPGGQVSHLWGTMHSSARLILDVPQALRAVIADARVFMPEFNPVAQSRAQLELLNRGEGFWADVPLPSLLDGIDPQVMGWIRARVQSMGYDDYALENLTRAGLAGLLLSAPCDDFAEGIIPIQDSRLQMLAIEGGAQVIGLESERSFINEMNKPSRRKTAEALIAGYGAYLGPHDVKASQRTAFHLYLTGQIGVMMAWDKGFFRGFFGEAEGTRIADLVNGYLVAERNLGFLRAAKPELNQGGVVIAVGTFHLPGETGMVSLLRGQGFTVERIVTPGEIE